MRFQAAGKSIRAVFDFDRTRIPLVFHVTVIVSASGIIVSVLRWPLFNLLSVFIEPLVEIAVIGAFLIALIWAIVHAIVPMHGARANRFSPLLVGLAALAVFLFVPFTDLYLRLNFAMNLNSRTVVAQRILAGKSPGPSKHDGSGDTLHLNGAEYALSDDGDVMVKRSAQKQMVFFFTFRGVLDHFSGFVYSANDAAPVNEDFGGEWVEVKHLRKNWYWAASI